MCKVCVLKIQSMVFKLQTILFKNKSKRGTGLPSLPPVGSGLWLRIVGGQRGWFRLRLWLTREHIARTPPQGGLLF